MVVDTARRSDEASNLALCGCALRVKRLSFYRKQRQNKLGRSNKLAALNQLPPSPPSVI